MRDCGSGRFKSIAAANKGRLLCRADQLGRVKFFARIHHAENPGEPLPVVGARAAVVDSAGRRVAVIELTEVRVRRLGDVDSAHARDEGEEGDWRAGHEDYWHGTDYRGWLGDPAFTVDDDTPVVLQRFRLAEL